VLLQVISLADALIHAEASSQNTKDAESLKKGISMVREQFEKFLSEQGLTPISAKGEKIDPHRHEAIARVVDPELEEGTIVDEIQRGYTMNGQLVRPSRVRVSSKTDKK
jgi:molecular chaperone GrpE